MTYYIYMQTADIVCYFALWKTFSAEKQFMFSCFLWDVHVTKMSFKLFVDVGMVEVTASHSYYLFLETFQLGFDWKFCQGNVSCRMAILLPLLSLQKQPLIDVEACLNFLKFGDIKGLHLAIYGNKFHWWTITAKTKDQEKPRLDKKPGCMNGEGGRQTLERRNF